MAVEKDIILLAHLSGHFNRTMSNLKRSVKPASTSPGRADRKETDKYNDSSEEGDSDKEGRRIQTCSEYRGMNRG